MYGGCWACERLVVNHRMRAVYPLLSILTFSFVIIILDTYANFLQLNILPNLKCTNCELEPRADLLPFAHLVSQSSMILLVKRKIGMSVKGDSIKTDSDKEHDSPALYIDKDREKVSHCQSRLKFPKLSRFVVLLCSNRCQGACLPRWCMYWCWLCPAEAFIQLVLLQLL